MTACSIARTTGWSARPGWVACGLAAVLCAGPRESRAFNPLDSSTTLDYVILTHATLIPEAQRLKSLAQARGLRTDYVTDSEVAAAFEAGGPLTDQGVRDLVEYAVQYWSITPHYLVLLGDANIEGSAGNLIPTHMSGPDIRESWFGGAISINGVKPVIHLGRIPARTATEANRYLDKVQQYELSGSDQWKSNVLMLIGDHKDAAIAPYADGLWGWIQSEYPWTATMDRATNYPRMAGEICPCPWQASANAATLARWNLGQGVVFAFGQLFYPPEVDPGEMDLVQLAYFRQPTTFTDQLQGINRCPFLLAPTCKMNLFHKAQSSVADDLLFKYSDRGVIGSLSGSTGVFLPENSQISVLFFEALLNQELRSLGTLSTFVATEFKSRRLGDGSVVDAYTLLGDPALSLRIPLTATLRVRWTSDFEIEDAPPPQGVVDSQTSGVSAPYSRLRVKSDTPNSAVAARGERMFQVKALDGASGIADQITWRVALPNMEIGVNTLLSFRLRIVDSPGGLGHVCVDGSTNLHTLGSVNSITDQHGVPLRAALRTPASGEWEFLYCDLTPLDGETLQEIVVKYEAQGVSENGQITAYVDDIRVFPTTTETEQLANGGFEDGIAGQLPDFWTDIPGAPGDLGVVWDNSESFEGLRSLKIADAECSGQGISQVFHAFHDEPYYQVTAAAMSEFGTPLRIRVRNESTGFLLAERTFSTNQDWSAKSLLAANPFYGQGEGLLRLELSSPLCSSPVWLDGISVRTENSVTDAGEGPEAAASGAVIRVGRNPIRPGEPVPLIVFSHRAGRIDVDLLDVAGRIIWRWRGESIEEGEVTKSLVLPKQGIRQPAGIFFLRVTQQQQYLGTARVCLLR